MRTGLFNHCRPATVSTHRRGSRATPVDCGCLPAAPSSVCGLVHTGYARRCGLVVALPLLLLPFPIHHLVERCRALRCHYVPVVPACGFAPLSSWFLRFVVCYLRFVRFAFLGYGTVLSILSCSSYGSVVVPFCTTSIATAVPHVLFSTDYLNVTHLPVTTVIYTTAFIWLRSAFRHCRFWYSLPFLTADLLRSTRFACILSLLHGRFVEISWLASVFLRYIPHSGCTVPRDVLRDTIVGLHASVYGFYLWFTTLRRHLPQPTTCPSCAVIRFCCLSIPACASYFAWLFPLILRSAIWVGYHHHPVVHPGWSLRLPACILRYRPYFSAAIV